MKLDILAGTTSRIIDVFIQDSSSSIGAGLTGVAFGDITGFFYLNDAPTGATQITLATMTIGTWASGGFIEVDQTDMPGVYSLGIPNAALTGADSVIVYLKGATNMAPLVLEIELTGYNPYAALATPTNITAGIITTVTNNSDMRGTDNVDTATMRGTDDALLAANINLTAGVIDTVNLVNTLTTYTGNTLQTADVATAITDIGNLNDPTVQNIVDGVLDEVITGAAHNTSQSLAKRIRLLAEAGVYESGLVWLDVNRGTAGTTLFENGTSVLPLTTMADANTLLAALPLHGVHFAANSNVTFIAAEENLELTGEDWTLALGGQSIAGSSILDATISGVSTGVPGAIRDCFLNACSFAGGDFINCALGDTIILTGATGYHFFDCHHAEMGASSTIDFGIAAGSEVHLHDYHGALIILNMGASDILHFSCADGSLTLDSTCTAGTINLAGTFGFTDNSSGTTINDLGQIYDRVGVPVGADISVDIAAVQTTVDAIPTTVMRGTDDAYLAASAPESIKKNTALSNFTFVMYDSTDHVTPKTGLTVAGTRSIDAGAFAAVGGSFAEIANGAYQFDALAADTNGDFVMWRFTSAGADDVFFSFKTSA